MRKLVLFQHISLDGFAASADGGLHWISYDQHLQQYADGIVATVGMPVYGRITYGMMAGYWPTVLNDPDADERSLLHAKWVDAIPKLVISQSLQTAEWNNTMLVRNNIAEAITELKNQEGKDMVVFGSPRLAHSLMEYGLIDEYQFTLNPVLLGDGIPVFRNVLHKTKLQLIKAMTLQNGVVGLHYRKDS